MYVCMHVGRWCRVSGFSPHGQARPLIREKIMGMVTVRPFLGALAQNDVEDNDANVLLACWYSE